jgi:hypothetical protein
LKEENVLLFIKDHKNRNASDIFGEGNYNFALYKYALEKVCEEERKEREEEERRLQESQPKISLFASIKNSKLYYFVSVGIVIFTAFIIAANYYLYVGGWSNVVNK